MERESDLYKSVGVQSWPGFSGLFRKKQTHILQIEVFHDATPDSDDAFAFLVTPHRFAVKKLFNVECDVDGEARIDHAANRITFQSGSGEFAVAFEGRFERDRDRIVGQITRSNFLNQQKVVFERNSMP
ncbi:MAG: hypothetical protein AAF492_31700 [Verrucomicrobiota bacterium]